MLSVCLNTCQKFTFIAKKKKKPKNKIHLFHTKLYAHIFSILFPFSLEYTYLSFCNI